MYTVTVICERICACASMAMTSFIQLDNIGIKICLSESLHRDIHAVVIYNFNYEPQGNDAFK